MKSAKNKILLVIGIWLAATIILKAQQFEGKAFYQSARKMDNFDISSQGLTPEMEAQIKKRMTRQFQKEYELTFNLSESLWKEAESLGGAPADLSSGGVIVQTSTTADGITYKNTAEALYMQESDVFGKAFLVKDQLTPIPWKITQETKKVGDYTAYKAVYQRVTESSRLSFNSEAEDIKTVMDTVNLEAWYTPDIPVSQGPTTYWGLPGLILEVTDGAMSYVCTKVVLNPKEGIKINQPSKGKVVTLQELQAITEEKSQEFMNKYSNGGNNIQIKIGRG